MIARRLPTTLVLQPYFKDFHVRAKDPLWKMMISGVAPRQTSAGLEAMIGNAFARRQQLSSPEGAQYPYLLT